VLRCAGEVGGQSPRVVSGVGGISSNNMDEVFAVLRRYEVRLQVQCNVSQLVRIAILTIGVRIENVQHNI
jgi:hypothetical protein